MMVYQGKTLGSASLPPLISSSWGKSIGLGRYAKTGNSNTMSTVDIDIEIFCCLLVLAVMLKRKC